MTNHHRVDGLGRRAKNARMPYELNGAVAASPLVFDSPHSWREWPSDAPTTLVSDAVLATSWDAFVDQIWVGAARGRAPVLIARFHRAFIDANRARDDIDPALLAQAWPGQLNPTKKSLVGQGLIRREALPGVPMYDRKLRVEEVQQRIARYYDPYHAALRQLTDAAHARFGFVCHINCHSMKSVGNAMNADNGCKRPDIVVSDLSGRSCAPALTDYIASQLSAQGYRVQVNDPYQGAELIRSHGDPGHGRHSVQIEINRGIYMHEKNLSKTRGFDRLVAHMQVFSTRLLQDLQGPLGAQLRA